MNRGIVHSFRLPEARHEYAQARGHGLRELPVEIEINDLGIKIEVKTADGFPAANVWLESYEGQLVLHVATARNPEQHAYRLVLGDVQAHVDSAIGQLVPSEVPVRDELQIDHTAYHGVSA